MSSSSFASRDALGLILAAASWGLGTVISKRALDEIPPLALLAVQLAASLVVLGVLMRQRGIPLRDAGAVPLLGRLGLLNPGLSYALSLIGLTSISASLSVMIWALEPLLILVLAAIVLRERTGPGLVVVSLAALAGLVLVLYDPATAGNGLALHSPSRTVGCCAVYTIVARHSIGRPTRLLRSWSRSRPTPSPSRSSSSSAWQRSREACSCRPPLRLPG